MVVNTCKSTCVGGCMFWCMQMFVCKHVYRPYMEGGVCVSMPACA